MFLREADKTLFLSICYRNGASNWYQCDILLLCHTDWFTILMNSITWNEVTRRWLMMS